MHGFHVCYLFCVNLLQPRIMHECIRNLLSKEDEESLECLCTLVTSIGKVLEQKTLEMQEEDKRNKTDYCKRGNILHFDMYFNQIRYGH